MLFSSLFDTGTKSDVERDLACALLQLLALSDRGPVLTTLHAFNSSLIDDSVDREGFLSLVEHGRITFRARYNGKGPRELLDDMLSTPDYVYLGAWPELIDKKEERKAAAAYLRKDTKTTGILSLDERIKRAQKLFKAIDLAVTRFGPLKPEAPYRAAFKETFERKVREARLPSQSTLGAFLLELSNDKVDHSTRTAVYREARQRNPDDQMTATAVSIADGITNALVAESLNLPLHTAYEDPIVGLVHDGPVRPGKIIELPPEEVQKVSRLRFDWKDVASVVSTRDGTPIGVGERELAITNLAESYAKRAVYAPAGVEGAAEEIFAVAADFIKEAAKSPAGPAAGAAAGGLAGHLAFVGPLGTLLFTIVGAALGSVAGKRAAHSIETHRVAVAKNLLTSFLDRVD